MKNRHTVFAVLGGAAGLALVCGALVVPVPGGVVSHGVFSTSIGWVVPLVSLLVIVAVTMALLSRDSKPPHDDPPVSAPCPHCGRSVFSDWRLCPYCGSVLAKGPGSLERGDA